MTKHLLKPKCKHECRFVQISDELWLCPHASYGRLSYMLGAVEEARRLMERAGGYDAMLAKIVLAEEVKKLRHDHDKSLAPEPAVRYG